MPITDIGRKAMKMLREYMALHDELNVNSEQFPPQRICISIIGRKTENNNFKVLKIVQFLTLSR
jgi:hypothetical protein